MTGVLYVADVLAVVVGFALMLWLRRESDEAWRRNQIRIAADPITQGFIRMQITIVDRLTPALLRAAEAVAEFGRAFGVRSKREQAISAELVRLTLGGRPERPELAVEDQS